MIRLSIWTCREGKSCRKRVENRATTVQNNKTLWCVYW